MAHADSWIRSPITNMRTLLSSLAAYQTFLGVADQSAALAKTVEYEVNDDPKHENYQTMPRGIVSVSGGRTRRRRSIDSWETSAGMVVVLFEQETPVAFKGDLQGAYNDFVTKLANIINEIEHHDGTTLNIVTIQELEPPAEGDTDENDGTQFWWAVYGFEYR